MKEMTRTALYPREQPSYSWLWILGGFSGRRRLLCTRRLFKQPASLRITFLSKCHTPTQESRCRDLLLIPIAQGETLHSNGGKICSPQPPPRQLKRLARFNRAGSRRDTDRATWHKSETFGIWLLTVHQLGDSYFRSWDLT